MSNLIKLDARRKSRRQTRAEGLTLCQSGFHKWQAMKEQRFDVRKGRLITTERCQRCMLERTILS